MSDITLLRVTKNISTVFEAIVIQIVFGNASVIERFTFENYGALGTL